MLDVNLKEIYDLFTVLGCLFDMPVPDQETLQQMDFQKLYRLAKYHQLTAMLAKALERCNAYEYISEDLKTKLVDHMEHAMYKAVLFDHERNEILAWFEGQGIWYLPLKGIVLQNMYPVYGIREMADNDILYDKQHKKQVHDYMVDRGYIVKSYDGFKDDIYYKKPVYNFEFHRGLFDTNLDYYDYSLDLMDRKIKDNNSSYAYHFLPEDFYIYLVMHAYKHYKGGSLGIRYLIDLYVSKYCNKSSMDTEYIDKELNKLGMKDFEAISDSSVVKLFHRDTLNEQEVQHVLWLSGSGIYGNPESKVTKRLEKYNEDGNTNINRSKARYALRRAFPDLQFIKMAYPKAYKTKVLIPFVYVYRLTFKLIRNRKKVADEIRNLRKIK